MRNALAVLFCLVSFPALADPGYAPYSDVGMRINGSNRGISGKFTYNEPSYTGNLVRAPYSDAGMRANGSNRGISGKMFVIERRGVTSNPHPYTGVDVQHLDSGQAGFTPGHSVGGKGHR